MSTSGVQVDAEAFARYARILDQTASSLEKALQQGQEKAARPLAAYAIREGAGQMPAHGGLRAELMAARAQIKTTSDGVEILMSTKQGYDLPKMDEGQLHHPVFGRYVPGLKAQRVPAGAWSQAFEHKAAEVVLPHAQAAVQARLDTIAREASSG